MSKNLSPTKKIRAEAEYFGIKCDLDYRITKNMLNIAKKYSEKYCRNNKCEFNYACCIECQKIDKKECNPIPNRCRMFLCSFILKKISYKDVKKMDLEWLRDCWD
ncbi:MAG: hypothetical protein GF317_00720 [Candidatus Lokiarchaeota archaeon]|nr:hypothetical protein [Candidatus Lokiarchaeota archaeon]